MKMDDEKKNTKVLSTDDIRKNALNWTLAGDVGLLAHLKQFSEDIFHKTQETQKHFNELLDDYNEVYGKIGNITNQFLALQNGQFVENRVYDEETPIEEKVEVKKVDEVEQEKLLLLRYKEAVEIGIKLLDTHFQELQLPPNSDSDEDEVSTGNPSLIWRPKNPYANKKFPLLIGSAEWWADDSIGLGNYDDNVDTDRMISESESDIESGLGVEKEEMPISSSSSSENINPISKKPTFMGSCLENVLELNKEDKFINANSDLSVTKTIDIVDDCLNFSSHNEDITKKVSRNEFSNEGQVHVEEDVGSRHENLSKKHGKMDSAFARELAAKLTSASSKNDNQKLPKKDKIFIEAPKGEPVDDGNLFDKADLFPNINNMPIEEKIPENDNIFFDDQNDDQLFSGSKNLFFQPASNIIFENDTTKDIDEHSESKNIQNTVNNIKTSQKRDSVLPRTYAMNDLFNDIDDDDTLFSSKPPTTKVFNSSMPILVKNKQVKTITEKANENKPERLFDRISDNLSDSSDVFGADDDRNIDYEIKIPNKTTNVSTSGEPSKVVPKNFPFISSKLHDSLGDFNKQPLDSSSVIKSSSQENSKNISSREATSILEEDETEDDLFSSFSKDQNNKKTDAVKNVYPLDDDDISLFNEKPKQQDAVSVSSSRSSIFDDVSLSKTKLASVFEKDRNPKTEEDLFNISNDFLFGREPSVKTDDDELFTKSATKLKEISLFNDFDDNDDLFGITKDKNNTGELFFVKAKDVFSEHKREVKENSQRCNIISGEAIKDSFKNSDVFNENNKKPSKLFIDDLENDDLFNNSVSSKTVKKYNIIKEESIAKTGHSESSETDGSIVKSVRKLKNELFESKIPEKSKASSESQCFANDLEGNNDLFDREKLVNDVSIVKPKPPSSLNIKKDIPNSQSKTKPSGKLSISSDLKARLEFLTKSAPTKEKVEVEETKPTDLDDPFEPSSNLLKCPSKDRVKVPVRRRPQSRRARQEAIRNSGMNFGTDVEANKPDEHPKPSRTSSCGNVLLIKDKSSPTFSTPITSNPLSPSTDEEDYFNVPELDKNFEKEDQRIFKSSLFYSSSSSKLDDNLLFDGAPVLSPLTPKKNPNEKSGKNENKFLSEEKKDKNDLFEPSINQIEDKDLLFSNNFSKENQRIDILFDGVREIKKDEKILICGEINNTTHTSRSSESITGNKKTNPNVSFIDSEAENSLFISDKSKSFKENQESDNVFDSTKIKIEEINDDGFFDEEEGKNLFSDKKKHKIDDLFCSPDSPINIKKEEEKSDLLLSYTKKEDFVLSKTEITANKSNTYNSKTEDEDDDSLFDSGLKKNVLKEEQRSIIDSLNVQEENSLFVNSKTKNTDKRNKHLEINSEEDMDDSLFTSVVNSKNYKKEENNEYQTKSGILEKDVDFFGASTENKETNLIFGSESTKIPSNEDNILFKSVTVKKEQKLDNEEDHLFSSSGDQKEDLLFSSDCSKNNMNEDLFSSGLEKKSHLRFDSKKIKSLFDDDFENDDDDENLFKASKNVGKKTEKKLEGESSSSLKSKKIDDLNESNKLLFDSEMDDENYLFGETFCSRKDAEITKREQRNSSGNKIISPENDKDKTSKPFVDPLGLMSSE